jgi:hypothetical protein
MADSLFDNRYRYDYIYPRGRSGETLRAVDTQDNERPVVIKRPAPNDAPPIRAGQEVSILNERKALQRLAGHTVAPALLGGGQFLVGGTAHQYIVMERGQGVLLADMVREQAQQGERLPELEMLVIVDSLLDLLQLAHARDIVYNDVDAKHLFWNRDNYRLKVIDWGNAVFLEGDEMTPQGISRQSDVFQVGELLYFIVSGGGRADVPRDAGEDFMLDFGPDAERLAPRLQAVISKAAHPNLKLRYKSMADLRKALNDYREPMERERNAVIGRVNERLRQNRSKEELEGLLETLTPALNADPGQPQARAAYREILARLRDLEVDADLDAARIYLESGNWARAVDLLDELRDKARGEMRALIEVLLDSAQLMLDNHVQPVTPAIQDAFGLMFERHNPQAAHILMTMSGDDRTRALYWLLAERLDAHSPDVMLLRPNLYRLEVAFTNLSAEGITVTEPRAVLAEINHIVQQLSSPNIVSLVELRDGYRSVVDGLTALGTLTETVNRVHHLPENRLPIATLERGLNAAMALADNMHVIGRQATASPRDATHALDSSRVIDPTNPVWDGIGRMLNGLYELLGSYQTYVPAADGSDLAAWLESTRQDLLPFQERLFDDMLFSMIGGLEAASQAWNVYSEKTILGDRHSSIESLTQAIDAVSTISPTLAGWLNQVRTIITNAQYVERHALYGGLGRALADGWEAFDRGRLADAERLGQQAVEIARTDSQRFAAERLRQISVMARAWIDRNVVNNFRSTQAGLVELEKLYTPDELAIRDNFASQMPSKDTYLKAMGKGLVELYSRNSTAAPRILFINFIFNGALDAHEGRLDDAAFWREAGDRVLGETASRHPLTRALTDFIERRRDLNTAAALLNSVSHTGALPTLDTIRKQVEDNPQARLLQAGIISLRELENALRDWSDGEFRAAGIKIENAIHAVNDVEQAASITLTGYRAWLMELQAGAAELYNQYRQLQAVVDSRAEQPTDSVHNAHRRMVEVTARLLGDSFAITLKSWRDTYESFLSAYTDQTIRRSEKLSRFNQLFRAMFIDRHPAYPLYRTWYQVTDNAPEFPAPPTSEPIPRIREDEDIPEAEYRGSRYADSPDQAMPTDQGFRLSPRLLIFGVGGLILLGVLAIVASALNRGGAGPQVDVTITDTPTVDLTATQAQMALAVSPGRTDTPSPVGVTPSLLTGVLLTPTLVPSDSPAPTILPPPLSPQPPTATLTPTLTATPSVTPTPTNTFTPTPTATATLPPQGLQGEQNLLNVFDRLPTFPWDLNQFSKVSAIDLTYWRLGSNEPGEPDEISIVLPAYFLETYFGNNAATRVLRTEVEMTLTTFNPTLLNTDDVYFGALLQDGHDPARQVGLHVRLVQPGVLSLGHRSHDQITPISQQAVSVYVVRARLDRDLASSKVVISVNGQQLGPSMDFVNDDTPVLPVLYVKNSGVIVSVTRWSVALR